MSQKKARLLRKYLEKRNAVDKIEVTPYFKNGKRKLIAHRIDKDIKSKYKSANAHDKGLLALFFKNRTL